MGSIFSGYFLKIFFINFGASYLAPSILNISQIYVLLQSEFLPFYIKLIPVLFSLIGLFLALVIYQLEDGLYFLTR